MPNGDRRSPGDSDIPGRVRSGANGLRSGSDAADDGPNSVAGVPVPDVGVMAVDPGGGLGSEVVDDLVVRRGVDPGRPGDPVGPGRWPFQSPAAR
jgi:hypothetical protein